MTAKVYCRENDGKHDFYVNVDKKEYFVFSQTVRKSVNDFYRNAVDIDRALCHGIGRRDHAIHHTMDKLILYIGYIESEYDIIILKKTKRKANRAA